MAFLKSKPTASQPEDKLDLKFNLRDESLEFNAWDDKVIEVTDIIYACDREESDVLGVLSTRTARPDNGMTKSVAALLGEAHEDGAAPNGLAARLHEIQARRKDARAALAIAKERRATARVTASRAICGRVAAVYKERGAALASALLAAVKANEAVAEISDALTAADILWVGNLPAVPAKMLGHRGERVAAWLHEAAGDGLIGRDLIPEGLR